MAGKSNTEKFYGGFFVGKGKKKQTHRTDKHRMVKKSRKKPGYGNRMGK